MLMSVYHTIKLSDGTGVRSGDPRDDIRLIYLSITNQFFWQCASISAKHN